MLRFLTLAALLGMILLSRPLSAQSDDDGPLISITSPDKATTFVYNTTKNHALVWDKKDQVLTARVTFTDQETNMGQPNDDTHSFRLPGVIFDATAGIYYATSSTGVKVPVAHIKKTLFLSSIETLPNARVRVQTYHGNVSVVLEAIRPDDPAMHPKPAAGDGSHSVDLHQLIQ